MQANYWYLLECISLQGAISHFTLPYATSRVRTAVVTYTGFLDHFSTRLVIHSFTTPSSVHKNPDTAVILILNQRILVCRV